ncbi:MAG: hypothetical protein AAB783_00955 [Patescibacteria group bacterium]
MNFLKSKLRINNILLGTVATFLTPLNDVRAQTVGEIAQTILDRIVIPFVNLLLVAATLFFMYGVIEYIAKSDSDEGRSTGRRHMIWGIVGLVIMVSAASIVLIIQNFWDGI